MCAAFVQALPCGLSEASAWLDTADLYRIRRAGLLLGRHGILVTWPVDELADRLLGRRVTGEHARDAFHDIAGGIITGHGLPWPVA
ncbi:hypothetical protein [Amycolatopsis alba]|uniref:hypothetical protein n=1 Tax=Amycolatopsis alba TaxID=76020 RepID=UPI0003A113EE|nr:hypothetical protein [Amycolatopsis alba]